MTLEILLSSIFLVVVFAVSYMTFDVDKAPNVCSRFLCDRLTLETGKNRLCEVHRSQMIRKADRHWVRQQKALSNYRR